MRHPAAAEFSVANESSTTGSVVAKFVAESVEERGSLGGSAPTKVSVLDTEPVAAGYRCEGCGVVEIEPISTTIPEGGADNGGP